MSESKRKASPAKRSKSPRRNSSVNVPLPTKKMTLSLLLLKGMFHKKLIKLDKKVPIPPIKDLQDSIIQDVESKKQLSIKPIAMEQKGILYLTKNYEKFYALLNFSYANLDKLNLSNINITVSCIR